MNIWERDKKPVASPYTNASIPTIVEDQQMSFDVYTAPGMPEVYRTQYQHGGYTATLQAYHASAYNQ